MLLFATYGAHVSADLVHLQDRLIADVEQLEHLLNRVDEIFYSL